MGKKAKCINNDNVKDSLTIGKEYQVLDYREYGITVIDDKGLRTGYAKKRFKIMYPKTSIEEKIEESKGQKAILNENFKKIYGTNDSDKVNHPAHYTNGKYECIDILEDITKDLKGLEAFCTANAIKYLWRWKHKNGVEDLKKANWYINKLIETIEKNK